MRNSNERMVYVFDYVADLFRSWKKILLSAIIIACLTTGLFAGKTLMENRDSSGEEMSAEAIESARQVYIEKARANLTESQIEEVDRLYKQFHSYVEYREIFQENFTSYMSADEEFEDEQVIKRVSYRLSSTIEGVENIISSLALGIDEYRAIMKVLPNVNTLTAAYNYVSISASRENSTTTLTNMGEETYVIPVQYMITVDIIGDTRSVCDEVWEIIDTAFQEERDVLKKVDSEIELEVIDAKYKGNVKEVIAQRQQSTFDSIQKIDTTINNLKNYYIDKLPAAQSQYFNALRDPDGGVESPVYNSVVTEEPSPRLFSLKIFVIGFVLGILLAVAVKFVLYVTSDRINTGKEVTDYYGISLINTFFVPLYRKGMFSKLIQRLYHVDSTDAALKTELLASDVCGMMKRSGTDSIYIIQTGQKEEDEKLIAGLASAISRKCLSANVHHGMPLEDAENLQEMIQHKNALMIVHTKETMLTDIETLTDICRRHEISLLGSAAIVDV